MKRVLVFSALALMACPSGPKKCDSNDDCAAGQTCSVQSGLCVAATTGGGSGGGTAGGGSGGGTAVTGGGSGHSGGGTAVTGGGTAITGGGTAVTGGGDGTTGGGTAVTGGGDGTTGGGVGTTGGGTGGPVQGDTCDTSLTLITGTMSSQTLDDATDDYNDSSGSCYVADGPDKAYAVTIPAGQRLTVTLDVAAGDVDTLLSLNEGGAASCGLTCVVNIDDTYEGESETLSFTNNTGADVDYFLVVDSWSGTGTFTLTTTIATPPSGDTCDGNEDVLTPGTPLTAQSLANYGDDYNYDNSATGCSFGSRSDRVYSVLVPAGQALTVTATPDSTNDLAVNIVDGAAACGTTCLAYGDSDYSGDEPETATLVNNTGADHTYLIIVDSFSGTGSYTLAATTFAPAADDSCGGALALDAGTLPNQSLSGYLDDFNGNTDTSTCSFGANPDRVYALSVPAGQRGVVSVSGTTTTVNLVAGATAAVCSAAPLECAATGTQPGFFNVGATDAQLFAIVDGDAAASFDLTFVSAVPPADDTCTTATSVLPTDGGTAAGDLVGFFNDYGQAGALCIPNRGVDRLYRLNVPANQRVALTLTPDNADAGLRTVLNVISSTATACETLSTRTCLPAAYDYNSAGFSNTSASARDYFVSVAEYNVTLQADGGSIDTSFHLAATVGAIPSGETCATAQALTGTAVLGSTVGFNGDTYVDSNSTTCFGTGGSPDFIYSVTLNNQQTLTVSPSATDPDTILGLNLLPANANCDAIIETCLAYGYVYPGYPTEDLTFQNTSGSTQTYLLQVATGSQSGSQTQPFSLNVTIAP